MKYRIKNFKSNQLDIKKPLINIEVYDNNLISASKQSCLVMKSFPNGNNNNIINQKKRVN